MSNRNNHRRKNNKREYTTEDLIKMHDAEKTARIFASQGYSLWAKHWREYSRSPPGTPSPPNYHDKPFFSGDPNFYDRKLSFYPGSLKDSLGEQKYNKRMNKDRRKNTNAHPPYTMEDLDKNGIPFLTKFKTPLKYVKQDREKSNAELGEITNEKGHPYLLIHKLKELKGKYPNYYVKRNALSVV